MEIASGKQLPIDAMPGPMAITPNQTLPPRARPSVRLKHQTAYYD